MENYPGVMIAHAVTQPYISKSCYQGILQTVTSYPGATALRIAESGQPAWSRNSLIRDFLVSPAEYIFFVNPEIGIPQDGLKKLVEAQKDVISGLYFQKYPPYNPTMKKLQPNEFGNEEYITLTDYPEGIIEVDIVGSGCLLIARDVIETITSPYFFSPEDDYSEDHYFSLKAKGAGYKLWVDTTVKCLHDTDITVNETLSILNKLR